jgi:hypothetical protein
VDLDRSAADCLVDERVDNVVGVVLKSGVTAIVTCWRVSAVENE